MELCSVVESTFGSIVAWLSPIFIADPPVLGIEIGVCCCDNLSLFATLALLQNSLEPALLSSRLPVFFWGTG